MSENTNNQKVVVVANLKSPVVGFVLALFLGWLGVDRFYKGGSVSILLGVFKLIGGLMFVVYVNFWLFFGMLMVSNSDIGAAIGVAVSIYLLWYVLDLILIPLGISLDNRKKLAIAQGGNQVQEQITAKSVGKSALNVAIGVIMVIGILILAGVIYEFFLS